MIWLNSQKIHQKLCKLSKIIIRHLQIKTSPLNEWNISNLQRHTQITNLFTSKINHNEAQHRHNTGRITTRRNQGKENKETTSPLRYVRKKQNIRQALETQTTAAIRIYSLFICLFSWHLLTRSNMTNSLCRFCKGFLYPRRILRLSNQCAAAPVLIITSSRTYCVSANCR